jgi:hypothetical protein
MLSVFSKIQRYGLYKMAQNYICPTSSYCGCDE